MTKRKTRRRILQLTGAALAGSLAGCTDSSGSEGTESTPEPTPEPTTTEPTPEPTTVAATETTTETETDAGYEMKRASDIESAGLELATVPLPNTPSEHTYARMGSDDASATATVYGNWKCPHTQEFVLTKLDGLVEEYVKSGDLAVEFRALAYRSGEPFLGADAPRAARAGLAVWNTDPESYWSYFESVFANQPQERYEWATTDQLVEFGTAAGVTNTARVERRVEAQAHADAVESTVKSATELGIYSVPRLEVGGEVVAPTVDWEATTELLEEATA